MNDWIDEYLIFGDPNCVPPRERQEVISIDGAPGRLWDACGEVEATVVLDGRVYMFTLFLGSDQATNGRELFDALAATIDLRPEDAVAPEPEPGSADVGARPQSGNASGPRSLSSAASPVASSGGSHEYG